MEFFDEDDRPRFLFQSKTQASTQTHQAKPLNKVFLVFTISFSTLSLLLSIFFLQIEPLRSLIFWLSLSLLVGPFAPSQLTGGDIRVGQGPARSPLIETEPEILREKQVRKKRLKPIRSDDPVRNPVQAVELGNGLSGNTGKVETSARSENGAVKKIGEQDWNEEDVEVLKKQMVKKIGEQDWNEEDVEVLKKQMVKNPVGKPRRWEVVAEAFDGRHGVESVVKKAKELGERKSDDGDSYAKFLKNRKPLDSRVESEIGGASDSGESGKSVNAGGGTGWSAGEDIALLNALKSFPKDVAMRWEKIAAAVPGKSKAACMKRITELKRDFRSSKAAGES